MASVTITASAVQEGGGNIILQSQVMGEALNAGAVVRKNATTGQWVKARANDLTNSGNRGQLAIALGTASGAGQKTDLLIEGDLTCAGLTAGALYCLAADTAGLIAPHADLATTNIIAFIGAAVSTTILRVKPVNTGVALT